MQHFPSLDQAYNMVLREKTQRSLTLQTQLFIEGVAMAVKRSKSDVVCFHCEKSGHIKAQCYRLVGFSPDFKFTRSKDFIHKGSLQGTVQQVSSSSFSTENSLNENSSQLSLTKDHIIKPMSLLNEFNDSSLNSLLVVIALLCHLKLI